MSQVSPGGFTKFGIFALTCQYIQSSIPELIQMCTILLLYKITQKTVNYNDIVLFNNLPDKIKQLNCNNNMISDINNFTIKQTSQIVSFLIKHKVSY